MKLLIPVCMLLAVSPRPQLTPVPAPRSAPIDARWLPEIGRVSVEGDGRRLTILIEKQNDARRQVLDLDALSAGARVLAARIGPWMSGGLAIVLAIEDGRTTSYHYVLSREAAVLDVPLSSVDLVDGQRGWFLSKALFTSTGEPYRIVDVHNPGGGDPLEITFRRGWPDLRAKEPKLDEKVFFDNCGGYKREPLTRGAAVLYDVVAVTESAR